MVTANSIQSAKITVEWEGEGKQHRVTGRGIGRIEYEPHYENIHSIYDSPTLSCKTNETYQLIFDFEPDEDGAYLKVTTGEGVERMARVEVSSHDTGHIDGARTRAGAPTDAQVFLEEGAVVFAWKN